MRVPCCCTDDSEGHVNLPIIIVNAWRGSTMMIEVHSIFSEAPHLRGLHTVSKPPECWFPQNKSNCIPVMNPMMTPMYTKSILFRNKIGIPTIFGWEEAPLFRKHFSGDVCATSIVERARQRVTRSVHAVVLEKHRTEVSGGIGAVVSPLFTLLF